jgi:urea transport system ATP-binding protein
MTQLTPPDAPPRLAPASAGAGQADSSGEVLLRCRDLRVSFGEVEVLKGVSLDLRRGESHFLIGPNGAGKTTLANVITGHVAATAGSVEFRDRPLRGAPWRRARKGIARKFQVPRVFPRLDARQNLELAGWRSEGEGEGSELGRLGTVAGEHLSHGQRQWLELQMTLAGSPLLAVLDEPTAGMTREDRVELAARIRRLRSKVSFLVVEHDLDFVSLAADRVSFLHQGELLASGTFAEIEAHPVVRAAYLGEAAS